MPKQPRNFSPQEKASVALAALKGEKTLAQIGSEFEVHPTQIGLWRKQALDHLPDIFKDNRKKERQMTLEYQKKLDTLYRIIGQRDTELDWLKKNCHSFTLAERRMLVEREHEELTITRQRNEGDNYP